MDNNYNGNYNYNYNYGRPMPVQQPQQEATVWTILGLAGGIGTIILSFFTKYSIGLGAISLVLAIVGKSIRKVKPSTAAIVCSIVGLIMAVAFAIIRYVIIITVVGYANGLMDNGMDYIFEALGELLYELIGN